MTYPTLRNLLLLTAASMLVTGTLAVLQLKEVVGQVGAGVAEAVGVDDEVHARAGAQDDPYPFNAFQDGGCVRDKGDNCVTDDEVVRALVATRVVEYDLAPHRDDSWGGAAGWGMVGVAASGGIAGGALFFFIDDDDDGSGSGGPGGVGQLLPPPGFPDPDPPDVPIPEPSSWMLMALGVFLLWYVSTRKGWHP